MHGREACLTHTLAAHLQIDTGLIVYSIVFSLLLKSAQQSTQLLYSHKVTPWLQLAAESLQPTPYIPKNAALLA